LHTESGTTMQLLFEMGLWDDALAEMEIVPEDLKEPAEAAMSSASPP
jgi:hypothetical protein